MARKELTQDSSKPVLAIRVGGRGRSGGTTACDFLIHRAQRAGRQLLIADGDRNNATLSSWYPGRTSQPRSAETIDVKTWITEQLDRIVATGQSLIVDLGGGDNVLKEYGSELGLIEFCEAAGIEPLAVYTEPRRDCRRQKFVSHAANC